MHQLLRRNSVKWVTAFSLLALLVAGSVFFVGKLRVARADAYTGCHGVQEATASTSAAGYTLTVTTIAQFGNGGEFGKGYCGSMKAQAIMSVPARGTGGVLTVTLAGDTTGSLSNSYNFPTAGTSRYSFTEYSPSAGPKCAYSMASFAIAGGSTLTATTKSVCLK
jgi:hypothetical protein